MIFGATFAIFFGTLGFLFFWLKVFQHLPISWMGVLTSSLLLSVLFTIGFYLMVGYVLFMVSIALAALVCVAIVVGFMTIADFFRKVVR